MHDHNSQEVFLKVIFVGTGAKGHVVPTLSLVDELARKGHEVHYFLQTAPGSESLKSLVEDNGGVFVPVPSFLNDDDKSTLENLFKQELGEALGTELIGKFYTNYREVISFLQVKYIGLFVKIAIFQMASNYARMGPYIIRECSDKDYNLVIADSMAPGEEVAFSLKLPLLISDFHIFNVNEDESFFNNMINFYNDDKGFRGSINAFYEQNHVVRSFDQQVNFYRHSIYRKIIYSPKEFYYFGTKEELQESRHIFLGNRGLGLRRENVVDNNVKKTVTTPRVYVSLGTEMTANTDILDPLVSVLAELGYETLFTFGGNNNMYKIYSEKVYPNVTYRLFVNQTHVLSNTDLYFCHAGASSIYEAIHFAVPMILIPQDFDQPENAKVVASMKIGELLDVKQENLEQQIKKMLYSVVDGYSVYKENILQLQEKLLASADAAQAVGEIEELLSLHENDLMVTLGDMNNDL